MPITSLDKIVKSTLPSFMSRVRNNFRYIAVSVGGAIVMAAWVLVFYLSRNNGQSELETIITQEPVSVVTETPYPTATPEPSQTPTDVPEPTNTPSPTPTPFGGGGRIFFLSDREEERYYEIYVMNIDGSGQIKLTHTSDIWENVSSIEDFSLFPDGTRIVFPENLSYWNIRGIYMLNTDGTGLTQLSDLEAITCTCPFNTWYPVGSYCDSIEEGCDPPKNIQNLSWSPDGKKIAFEVEISGNVDIYSMLSGGTEIDRVLSLDRLTANSTFDSLPVWSPDGQRIAFEAGRAGTYRSIYTMNSDGSEQTLFVYGGSRPAWSPDGQKIAFVSYEGGDYNLYVMNIDRTNKTMLTNNISDFYLQHPPRWSPDGEKIVFVARRDGNSNIYLINSDGTGETRLTDLFGSENDPIWSLNGERIIFVSNLDGDREIYSINIDGTGLTQLTHNSIDDYQPRWQPNPGD